MTFLRGKEGNTRPPPFGEHFSGRHAVSTMVAVSTAGGVMARKREGEGGGRVPGEAASGRAWTHKATDTLL